MRTAKYKKREESSSTPPQIKGHAVTVTTTAEAYCRTVIFMLAYISVKPGRVIQYE